MTIGLNVIDSSAFYSGDGIAYNSNTDTLFAVGTQIIREGETLADRIIEWSVREIDPATGRQLSSFTIPELASVIGLSPLPNGNLLLSAVRDEQIVEVTTSGEIVEGGIDIPVQFVPGQFATTGVVFDEITGNVFSVDGPRPLINQFSTDGTQLASLDLSEVLPDRGKEGIAIDSKTGNFLVLEDDTGDNELHEVNRDGQVLSTINLTDLTGFTDPEGISIDPETRTLYVVFDNDENLFGDEIVSFEIVDLGDLRIEAEDYDRYYDSTHGNIGGAYRHDDVDIAQSQDVDDGFAVGWIEEGEWLGYDIDIAEAGLYTVVARVASDYDIDHSLNVSFDGHTTELSFGDTGGWHSWEYVTGDSIYLEAGYHSLDLNMGSSGFNINYIELVSEV